MGMSAQVESLKPGNEANDMTECVVRALKCPVSTGLAVLCIDIAAGSLAWFNGESSSLAHYGPTALLSFAWISSVCLPTQK